MQKYNKTCFISFFLIIIFFILILGAMFYIKDPLQVWHKSFFGEPTYSYTIRESARAIIRDYDFNSVIIGNSLSENTSAAKASEILSGGGNFDRVKFFNLSISGSTTCEKKIILDYLLKNKDIKQVIYFLDENYRSQSIENKKYPIKSYDVIYNNNPYDDFKIYMNDKYFKCIIEFSNSEDCIGKKRNMDKPYAWDDKEKYLKRFGGFENWIKNRDDDQIKDVFKEIKSTPKAINYEELPSDYISKSHDYINRYLYSVIKKNKNTKFYIIIPPVSDIELSMYLRSEKQRFKKYSDMLKYLVKTNKDHKNVELYAFDDIENIGNIKLYKDRIHFNTDINYFILNSIAKKEHLLTEDNINEYLKKVEEKAKKVDFDYYYDSVKQLI